MERPVNRPPKVGDRCMLLYPPENYGKQVVVKEIRLDSEWVNKDLPTHCCETLEPVYAWTQNIDTGQIISRHRLLPAGQELWNNPKYLVPIDDFNPDADETLQTAPTEQKEAA